MIIRRVLVLLFLSFFTGLASAQDWDWHIDNATIIDGTGQDSYEADLLIRDNSVGFIGQVNPDTISAQNYMDASGKVLTPGFIDSHAHGDPLKNPEFKNFLAMGVTTIVLGQDGSSPMVGNLDEWFARVEEASPAVNIAMFSGHGSIRRQVEVGKQKPSATELDKMVRLLESDLKDGAFGMSTGLEYVPGIYAQKNELQQMAKVVGQYDGLIMSHMRSEDNSKIKASIKELAAQGKYAPVHISHLKVVYGKGQQRAEEILNYIDSLDVQGNDFTADVYPYEASFTGISIVFPEWAKTEAGWRQAMKERPDMLDRYLEDKLKQRNGPEAILFGSGKFTGQTLAEISKHTGQSPVDLLLEIGPEGASAAYFVMNKELQDHLVADEKVMISSDGSPMMYHPRGYGSFAKIIEHYVKEEGILNLEQAIYKMSGLPAQTLGLESRGTIEVGNKADLLIFDPQAIKANATYANPHKLSEGFNWIMVNGNLIRKDGYFVGERKGEILQKESS